MYSCLMGQYSTWSTSSAFRCRSNSSWSASVQFAPILHWSRVQARLTKVPLRPLPAQAGLELGVTVRTVRDMFWTISQAPYASQQMAGSSRRAIGARESAAIGAADNHVNSPRTPASGKLEPTAGVKNRPRSGEGAEPPTARRPTCQLAGSMRACSSWILSIDHCSRASRAATCASN
jgi:hypothetical protein